MHDAGESFSNQLSNLSTIIITEGMYQIVGPFHEDAKKFRD